MKYRSKINGGRCTTPKLLPPTKETFQKIIETVQEITGVRIQEILGSSRVKEIAFARRMTAYLCRDMSLMSQSQISSFMNLDITSVSYMIRKTTDREMADDLTVLTKAYDIIFNKKKFVGKTTLGNNSKEKDLVSLGLYDDGILVTVNYKSTKYLMTSRQMVDLAIGLLERSQNSRLSEKKYNNQQ